MHLAVVVPTKGRQTALAPLAANIDVTAEDVDVLFVLDPDDQESWDAVDDLDCLAMEFDGGYPQKANAGFKATKSELVLIAGDDVIFHDGWYEAALEAFEPGWVGVVAANDMSPMAGVNATFPIVRRAYIEKIGGAWGELGTVYHDGYLHNFCDTELWGLALHRNVGRYAPECRVEHLHPAWGKAEVDDTYREGGLNSRGWAHDEQLFAAREAEWRA